MTDCGKIILYQAEDGQTEINVRLGNETVWLNLNQMAELFGRDKFVISAIFFRPVNLRNRQLLQKMQQLPLMEKHIKLTGITWTLLSLCFTGATVLRGTRFRIWVTSVLKDHLVRGSASIARGGRSWISSICMPLPGDFFCSTMRKTSPPQGRKAPRQPCLI